MTRFRRIRRGALAITGVLALGAATWLSAPSAIAAPNHDLVVSAVPSVLTPDIMDMTVSAIYDAGTKVIAGGTFTRVRNRGSDVDIPRDYVLAFDKATGDVDTAFAPVIDGEVNSIIAGPAPGTVYLAGAFNKVDGTTRRKVALLNVSDGSLVSMFKPPAFNAKAKDVLLVGGRLLVGGVFTTAGSGNPRGGLASLDATTGRLDTYLTVNLTEHHNYDGNSGANAPVGVENLAVAPDGTQLVVIGNFKKADGVIHDQVVKLDLGADAATIANWNTDRYTPRCSWRSFDSWVRDVAYSPDGSYFVIVTTGAPNTGTLCDSAARWESKATGSALQPTWISYTGGDTLLSVAISETSVYVGGHQRWMNNSLGRDSAQAGAVPRASLAALDPINGVPQAWNPGRHPRGYGVDDLYLTPEGLWIGSDQGYIGNFQYRRERIAFFPLAGGAGPHSTAVGSLPGNVYQLGVNSAGGGEPPPPTVLYRVNAGGAALAATDGGPGWTKDNGTTNPLRNSGSSKSANTTVNSVDGTVPASTPLGVFQSLRYDKPTAPEMEWNFSATSGIRLEVRLYFAEPSNVAPGTKKFDVKLDGVTVLNDFDIAAAVGRNQGTMRTFTITSDGNVDLDFIHVSQNPHVNGIEIRQLHDAPAPSATNGVTKRTYDGASTVGPAVAVANTDNTTWSTARSGFWVGGSVFYGVGSTLHRRTFNGTSFGPASVVDPYRDPLWDTVVTGSGTTGQTYRGSTTNFYPEIPNVTGMYYAAGRLYYTLSSQNGLFWRWFNPDSGIVGPDKFTVSGASGFLQSGGIFVSGSNLYIVNRLNGQLSRMNWNNGAPSGTATVVSGPTMGGVDWRSRVIFVGP